MRRENSLAIRFRTAIFFAAAAIHGTTLLIACSSDDRPGGASGETLPPNKNDGGVVTTDGSVIDGSTEDGQPLGDAGTPPFSDDGSCLDDRPAPTIDGGFQGGDDSGVPICPTTGTCTAYCNDVVAHYKLGLAQVIVTCLRELPSCSQELDVQLCVDNALQQACKDPTAANACTPLVKPCDPNAGDFGSAIDEPGCELYMRGLSSNGRGVLSSCIQGKIDAGTCKTQVDQCTDQIRK